MKKFLVIRHTAISISATNMFPPFFILYFSFIINTVLWKR